MRTSVRNIERTEVRTTNESCNIERTEVRITNESCNIERTEVRTTNKSCCGQWMGDDIDQNWEAKIVAKTRFLIAAVSQRNRVFSIN